MVAWPCDRTDHLYTNSKPQTQATHSQVSRPFYFQMNSGNLFTAKCVIVGDGAVGKVHNLGIACLSFMINNKLDLFAIFLR